ncbi:MAG TPA: DUF5681 domain-containing protein [Terriglobales bacterium]|nr:DUF5681 domain-containing protein [Terriglobales bacterium]
MHGEYEVGYKKPPEETQFQKGRSGNPKGRPKGSKSFKTVMNQISNEKVEVTERGRRRKMTSKEAAVRQLRAKALSGDHRARTEFLVLCRQVEAPEEEASTTPQMHEREKQVISSLMSRVRKMQGTTEGKEEGK